MRYDSQWEPWIRTSGMFCFVFLLQLSVLQSLFLQLCTDYLQMMAKSKAKCMVNDRQLTGVRINTDEGKVDSSLKDHMQRY